MWRFINIQIRERESREKAEHFEWKPTKKSAERNDIAKVYHPAAKWQTHAYSHEKKILCITLSFMCIFFYSSFYFRDFYFEPHILWIRWRCEFADLTQSHSHLTRRQGWIVKDRFVFFLWIWIIIVRLRLLTRGAFFEGGFFFVSRFRFVRQKIQNKQNNRNQIISCFVHKSTSVNFILRWWWGKGQLTCHTISNLFQMKLNAIKWKKGLCFTSQHKNHFIRFTGNATYCWIPWHGIVHFADGFGSKNHPL